ncbi:hypothetical protein GCM10009780_32890 [Actinomadura alba]
MPVRPAGQRRAVRGRPRQARGFRRHMVIVMVPGARAAGVLKAVAGQGSRGRFAVSGLREGSRRMRGALPGQ